MSIELNDTPVADSNLSDQLESGPRYLYAASLHNKATGNDSIFGGIGDFFQGVGESIKNAPKFWGAAAASGGIGLINTGIAIGNIFGSKQEQIDVEKWLTEYDTDLGKYYRENASGIDAAGFVLSSIIPGGAGVKTLNVAQRALRTAEATGTMGTNMARATGLLVPKTEKYIAQSAQTLAATNQRFKWLEQNTLKALGSGVHQNTLEAVAFEAFTLAANSQSNFLKDMDASDIAINMATGVLLGGAIGGALSSFGIKSGIKKETIKLDALGEGALRQKFLSKDLPAQAQIAQDFLNREGIETWLATNKAGVKPGEILPDGRTAEVLAKQVKDAERSITDINNKIRTRVHELVPNTDVANKFADTIIGLPSRSGANAMLGTEAMMRVGDVVVPAIGRLFPKQSKLVLEGAESIMDSATSGVQWTRTWGSRAGDVFDEMPLVTTLADRVKLRRGQKVEDAVNAVTKSFKHSARKPLDVMGSRGNMNEIQSRYLAAQDFKLRGPQAIKESDIPVLEAAYDQFDSIGRVDLVNVKGNVINAAGTKEELLSLITTAKDKAVARGKARGMSIEEIAERTNVRADFLDGTKVASNQYENYFARQYYAKDMGLEDSKKLFYTPSYMGLKQDVGGTNQLSDMALDAETHLAQMSKAAQSTTDNAVAFAASYLGQDQIKNLATGGSTLGNLSSLLVENSVLQEAIVGANRFGSGARLFSFANGNYGSLESMVQQVGAVKKEMDRKGMAIVHTEMEDVMRKIRTDVSASTELSVVNETLARMPIRYGLDTAGQRLIPMVHLKDIEAGAPLRALNPGVLPEIKIKNPITFEAVATHIKLNGQRLEGMKGLRSSQGKEFNMDSRSFYPIKPDPINYPYHAFVIDPTITGAGRATMIHATSADHLARMIRSTENEFPAWKVITKKDSEAYHKAVGDYEYSKTMNDNYVDASLQTRGINSQVMPQTDGKLVAGKFEDWHNRQVRAYNAEIISTKYAQEFDALEALGREFGNLSEARYPDMTSLAMGTKNNPYVEYVKTALNVSNMSDYGWLTNTNRALDSVVSGVWNRAAAKIKEIKGVSKGELDAVNQVFADSGFKTAYYDAAKHLLANHPADNAVLSRFIRGANSILATTFLRLDWFNAINNKIGSLILTSTETRHLLSAIESGNAEVAGKLAQIGKSQLPGTGDMILTPSRLMARSYQNFFTRKDLVQKAMDGGFIPSDVTDAFRVIDNLTLNGTESTLQLSKKLQEAFDGAKKLSNFGEKWTGNRLVETLNRFVSYDVMRQVTDLGVQSGVITAKEAGSYINTFINRTQVNLNASQRPLIFQGPVGMAMGLFQSYQFNLMQQLFRYVGDGSRKTAGYMMGMQGSMYGLNGLPGFQAFNEHIIGQAAGNYEHKDIASTLREGAPAGLADFLLYGAPSNFLQANLFTRGDLTPQHATILPSSIGDIAAVSMYGKMFGNLKNTITNVAGGADIWKSVLSGLEHNSMNRPLAGLAQTLRGLDNGNVYSTDNAGNVIASNDLWSLATLARIAGGKPIDEAIVRDEKYRISAYRQSDIARRASASKALRTSLTDSGTASAAQMDKVFEVFLQTGGKTKDFNKWYLGQFKKANQSDMEVMSNSLSDPYAYRMQLLMGGDSGVTFNTM